MLEKMTNEEIRELLKELKNMTNVPCFEKSKNSLYDEIMQEVFGNNRPVLCQDVESAILFLADFATGNFVEKINYRTDKSIYRRSGMVPNENVEEWKKYAKTILETVKVGFPLEEERRKKI